jgi:peptide/nickel transport system substrate-binding protein
MTKLSNIRDYGISRRNVLMGAAATMAAISIPGLVRAAGDKPLYGGTFVVGCATEPRHLNLNIATDITIKLIANPVYNKLVGLKSDLTQKPDLAETWSASDDKLSYTFNLRDGIKWHDGTPFSAEDVKFTFEEILFKNHAMGKTLAPNVAAVEAPDARTVVFRLKSPNDVLITFIAGQGFIQAKHIYAGTDIMQNPANLKPVGTGSFKFVSWDRGQTITLERNPDYFLAAQPYVDRIVTRFIPEATARIRALEAGEVDYVTYADLPASAIAELRVNPDIEVTSKGHEAWGSLVQLMPNFDRENLRKLDVRRAIAHAIDPNFIIQKAVYDLANPATGPISSRIAWAYTPDTMQYPHDVEKANALLDAAGYPKDADGVRFKAKIVMDRGIDTFVKVGEIIAEQLKPLGITLAVTPFDAATVDQLVFVKRDFDFYLQSFVTGPDPAMGVQRQYISNNIRPVPTTNASGYRNPKADELLNKAAQSGSHEERAELYKSLAKLLCEDCANIWIYENPTFSAFSKKFGNLHTWAAESIYSYSDVYWKEGSAQRA